MSQSITSVRSRPASHSAKGLLLAAAVASVALGTAASSASAAISVHVTTSKLSFWITIELPHLSNVSPTGNEGHVTVLKSSLSGMDMLMADLPAFQGMPTTPMVASDVDMFMGSGDIGPDFGGPVAASANWGIWVTGKQWGVHIIWNSADLFRTGMQPDGTLNYSTMPGAFIPAQVEYIDPSGASSFEVQNIEQFEFHSPAPLPAPGAAAMLGLGGLVAMRRRRA
ncbi:MAG: hypothetical protein ACKVS8_12470 [Phycisphaerales bacterium]